MKITWTTLIFFPQLLYSQLTQFIPLLDFGCLQYAVKPQWGRYAQQVLAKPLGLTACLVFLVHPVVLACVRFQAESSDYSGCCSCYFCICLAASSGTEQTLYRLEDLQSSPDNTFKVLNIFSVQNKSHRIHSWVFQRGLLKCTWFWYQIKPKPLSVLTAQNSATQETKGVILCAYYTSPASLRFPNIQTKIIPRQLLLTSASVDRKTGSTILQRYFNSDGKNRQRVVKWNK